MIEIRSNIPGRIGPPLTETPDGLRFVRAAGGRKIHLLPHGTYTSLCGHTPTNKYSRHMRGRAKWYVHDINARQEFRWDPESQTRVPYIPWCEMCQQARADYETKIDDASHG